MTQKKVLIEELSHGYTLMLHKSPIGNYHLVIEKDGKTMMSGMFGADTSKTIEFFELLDTLKN